MAYTEPDTINNKLPNISIVGDWEQDLAHVHRKSWSRYVQNYTNNPGFFAIPHTGVIGFKIENKGVAVATIRYWFGRQTNQPVRNVEATEPFYMTVEPGKTVTENHFIDTQGITIASDQPVNITLCNHRILNSCCFNYYEEPITPNEVVFDTSLDNIDTLYVIPTNILDNNHSFLFHNASGANVYYKICWNYPGGGIPFITPYPSIIVGNGFHRIVSNKCNTASIGIVALGRAAVATQTLVMYTNTRLSGA